MERGSQKRIRRKGERGMTFEKAIRNLITGYAISDSSCYTWMKLLPEEEGTMQRNTTAGG